MWAQIKQINFGFIFLIVISILSLNPLLSLKAVAKDEMVNKDAAIRTESKAVDAWQVNCNFGKNNQKLGCSAILKITQKIAAKTDKDKPQDSVVMLWQIGKGSDGRYVSSIQTPTGVLIKPGVQLKLASVHGVTLTYVACDSSACTAGAVLDDNLLQQAKKAQTAEIVLQSIDGKAYTYSFSPKGIDKAILEIN
jgi:invasion protein IalB